MHAGKQSRTLRLTSTKFMKRKGYISKGIGMAAMIATAMVLTTGCAHRRTVVVQQPVPPPGQEVLVMQAPPTVIPNEPIPVSPGRDYVWTAGHYAWKGDKYVWVPGKYIARPRASATWEPGHWEHRRKGWYWVEGHWVS